MNVQRLTAVVVLAVSVLAGSSAAADPAPSLWGFRLGESTNDVLQSAGKPNSTTESSNGSVVWLYRKNDLSIWLIVTGGSVKLVHAMTTLLGMRHAAGVQPDPLGVSLGDDFSTLFQRLGTADSASAHAQMNVVTAIITAKRGGLAYEYMITAGRVDQEFIRPDN